MARTIQAQSLTDECTKVLRAGGSSEDEARRVAENLVLANLSGHDSHGVGMIPRYIDSILEGGLQPNTHAKVNVDLNSLLALDGQRGYGQIVGEEAMVLGMQRAKKTGSCVMTLGNAHHLGRIGHFAEMAVAQELVSIHFVNVLSRPTVAPWGGADGRFGTNPSCIGIPLKGREPFLLDFATSRVAQGKMRVAHNEGREVEAGLLIDEHGKPTTDPGVVVVPQSNGLLGALLTFGEHKGYGMAVACELLGGALSGGGTWHKALTTSRAVYNGMLTLLIDPQQLGTREAFESESLAFVDWVRKSPPGGDSDGVMIAGEPERKARAERRKDGIVVDDTTWNEIVEAGKKVGYAVVG
ncbi:MAG TPA: malate/lactate/ureidoglycolate dehydrogenase [Ramlibacter sp.]|nr:malate/lactate/ureidoglycolate dehydrogenase [Ramlibacter sp.]